MVTENYNGFIHFLEKNGDDANDTKELLNVHYRGDFFSTIHRKKMNVNLAVLEAAMFCGGIFDLSLIRKVSKSANLHLYEKQSDYGIRTKEHTVGLLNILKDDILSRRAVTQFNMPSHFIIGENNFYSDLACTLTAQIKISSSSGVNLLVNMRSWDAVYGLPMDVVMFGTYGQMVTSLLNNALPGYYSPGKLFVNAGSFHTYESTKHLASSSGSVHFYWKMPSVFSTEEMQEWFAEAAISIANGEREEVVAVRIDKSTQMERMYFSGDRYD